MSDMSRGSGAKSGLRGTWTIIGLKNNPNQLVFSRHCPTCFITQRPQGPPTQFLQGSCLKGARAMTILVPEWKKLGVREKTTKFRITKSVEYGAPGLSCFQVWFTASFAAQTTVMHKNGTCCYHSP